MADGTAIFPSGASYVTTLEVIGKIDQVEAAAATFLSGVPKDWSQSTKAQIASYMAQMTSLIGQLNKDGVTGIRDKNSQSQIVQTIGNIGAIVNIILTL